MSEGRYGTSSHICICDEHSVCRFFYISDLALKGSEISYSTGSHMIYEWYTDTVRENVQGL